MASTDPVCVSGIVRILLTPVIYVHTFSLVMAEVEISRIKGDNPA